MHAKTCRIDTSVPACFIERSPAMIPLNRTLITHWLCIVNHGYDQMPKDYLDYISTELLNADNNDLLHQTIQHSKHIWCSSSFIHPNSAELFVNTLKHVQQSNITHKYFFDWTHRKQAMSNLSQYEPSITTIIQAIESERAIRLFFFEEINQMLEHPDKWDLPAP